MRKMGLAILVAVPLAMMIAVGSRITARAARPDDQVIEVSAKKFDFTPAEIHVKAGAHVILKVTATDRTHGIEIGAVAEGAPKGSAPGLKFDAGTPGVKVKLPENQTQEIGFTAVTPGTYDFHCSEFCGTGHRGMKGAIIVDP
jgi:cytochrome c oxidase subunit II